MKSLRRLIGCSLIVVIVGCGKGEILCRRDMVKAGSSMENAVLLCSPYTEVTKRKPPSPPKKEKKKCCVCK